MSGVITGFAIILAVIGVGYLLAHRNVEANLVYRHVQAFGKVSNVSRNQRGGGAFHQRQAGIRRAEHLACQLS